MNRSEFLSALKVRLSGLSPAEAEKQLAYYAELIDDRIEEGMPEEEAVAALGEPEQLAQESLAALAEDAPAAKPAPHRALWIVLAVVGSPIWFSLIVAAAAVALAVYICLWAAVISLFACVLALGAAGLALTITALLRLIPLWPDSLMILGAGLICAGLCIPACLGALYVARLTVKVTLKLVHGKWKKREEL